MEIESEWRVGGRGGGYLYTANILVPNRLLLCLRALAGSGGWGYSGTRLSHELDEIERVLIRCCTLNPSSPADRRFNENVLTGAFTLWDFSLHSSESIVCSRASTEPVCTLAYNIHPAPHPVMARVVFFFVYRGPPVRFWFLSQHTPIPILEIGL